jgi:hypothetical protein
MRAANDAAKGLSHEINRTINRCRNEPYEIVDIPYCRIVGLISEAGPTKQHLVPIARQSLRNWLPGLRRTAGTRQEQDLSHFCPLPES